MYVLIYELGRNNSPIVTNIVFTYDNLIILSSNNYKRIFLKNNNNINNNSKL